ncbi:MAG: RNA polymerase subunit sigma [Chloroflexi bacterium HGW-Chloroflexi-10]|nr:MAG: RNA polymerase subunit sigma [Chloroflexi bacterium HGW-Chloroflexi-10]
MLITDNEAHWIRRAGAGDTHAFAELVQVHQQFVFNLALRATNHQEEAEDLAQEAFIRAWRYLPTFRAESSFRTWLYRIVMNLVYDRYPRIKHDLAAISIDENEVDIPEDAHLEQAIDQHELRNFLRQQLQHLPESYRLVLLMRFQQNLSYQEIATITGLPMGTVKTTIFRAKAQLKTALMAHQEVVEWIG